jgi:hypothetical protein
MIFNQRYRSGSAWIRISFGLLDPDPDPGGQNDPQGGSMTRTKIKRDEISYSEVPDVFFRGYEASPAA